MQATIALCMLAFLAPASASAVSPVTRVVGLLKDLQKTAENDGKAEEDLYESFVCWGKSVIEQKTASNAAATSRIDSLTTFIADTEADLERARSSALEEEISGLQNDLEEADSMRQKENSDFKDAKSEMTSAITALDSAIGVLGKATKGHKTGVLLAVRSSLSQGMEAFEQQQQNLKRAVQLGENFLEKADAAFLRRLLTGDVPNVDYKKLSRKATYKMAYKARSFKIQDVLAKMQATFTQNLKSATAKEKEAASAHKKLSDSKNGQLKSAQKALSGGKVDSATRSEAVSESEKEVAALKKQIIADTDFIKVTAKSLVAKKKEYVARQDLRAGEIAAISKAIYILSNDDARDLMKKSFSSQEGLFFLQTAQQSSSAADALRKAAKKSGDARLLSLVADMKPASQKTKFAPIIKSINKMIKTLKSEEGDDLKTVEGCERGRMDDTREAAVASRGMDDDTDEMARLQGEIDDLAKEIKELQEDQKAAEEELAAAAKQRKRENKEWQQENQDDTAAAKTVNNAKNVLVKFYKDNKLALVQKASAPVVEAGKAPPPPPDNMKGSYGGKVAESQGIISMLTMVHDDILKDKAKAKADEEEAAASFAKFKKETENEIKDLKTHISKKQGLKADRETKRNNEKAQRTAKFKTLNAVMGKIEEINPNCEYFAVNYKMRVANRATEMDGLLKARAIMQGGTFDKGPDPNREIKPGDAFLQRRALRGA